LILQFATWRGDDVRANFQKNDAGLGRPMLTIEDWLSQLGLSKYMEAFVQNDVDLRALPHITETDCLFGYDVGKLVLIYPKRGFVR
jgi:hypothetical protein